MGVLSLLKKSSFNCPHCQAAFELGPDIEALSKTAGGLLEKLGSLFSGSPFDDTIDEISTQFEVSREEAIALLAAALNDETVIDSIYDFIEDV